MTILIASQTAAADSASTKVISGASVRITATTGIASGEDVTVDIATATDTWTTIADITLTDTSPSTLLSGPAVFRVSKPTSALVFAVELTE